MGKINLENYEFYVIDYIEGNLSEQLKKEFEEFLSQNPEIFDLIYDIKKIKVEKPLTSYDKKISLKQSPINGISYKEYLFISAVEGNLSEQEKRQLKEILKNKAEKREFVLYSTLRLAKNLAIFPFKNKLKRRLVFKSFYYAAAALIILMIGFTSFFNFFDNEDEQQKYKILAPQFYALQLSEVKKPNKILQRNPIKPALRKINTYNYNFIPQEEELLADDDLFEIKNYLTLTELNKPTDYKPIATFYAPYEDYSKSVKKEILKRINLPTANVRINANPQAKNYGIKVNNYYFGVKF